MSPALVALHSQVKLDEGAPLRSLRFSNQVHARLARRVIGLPGVALDTGAHNVLPRGWASLVSWNYVIQVQVHPLKCLAAILASILVPDEDVVAGELHFLPW